MTIDVPQGLWRDSYHRYFYADRGPLPSVTTVVGVLDKSGPLVGWAKRETAACAVRNLDLLNQMVRDGGRQAAQDWLSRIPDYIRDEKADLGSRVHALAEAVGRADKVVPTADEAPFLRAYLRFLDHVNPEIVFSEAMVVNLALGYGGTFDIGARIDGAWTLLDIKTGRDVYPETALQLAGYDLAEFSAKPDDPTPVKLPRWERHGVVHIMEDDWSLIPFDVNDETRRAFREALGLWRWNRDASPWAKGRPVKEGWNQA